jgi:tetratricopeptide (TPR) repeat protein
VIASKSAVMILLCGLVLDAATTMSPGQAAYEKANRLLVAQMLPEAVAAVDEALRLDPKLVPALTLKAKLAMAGYRLDIAHQCLEQALALDPHAAYAQFLYGLEAYLGNDLAEALPRFRKARQLSPTDPRAALYLGLTVESLGQPKEALSLYEEAVRLERSAGALHAETLLPGARLLLLTDRLEDCERWVREALKLSPKSRDVHFELARLLLKKGDAAQAAAEGESALSLSEGVVTDGPIHYLLIRAYRQSGMPDRAAFHADVMRVQETPANSAGKNQPRNGVR